MRWIGLRDRYGERSGQKENGGIGEGVCMCVCVCICAGWVDLDLMQFEIIYIF